MKTAKNQDEKDKKKEDQQMADAQPASTETAGKQTLDDIMGENGEHYDALNEFVTDIKQLENNSYKNFSEFGKNFYQSYEHYIQQSSIKDEIRFATGFPAGLKALLNSTSITVDKKKQYMQRMINQIMPVLSSDYAKIKNSLSPENYHNMVKGSLNDPMIMVSPFTTNLKQELGKNENYGRTVNMSQMSKDMENDLEKGDFSKLADYFEKIPYNRDTYKKLNLNDRQIDKMMDDANKIFRDVTSDLNDDSKKQIMSSLMLVLSEESDKQFSKLDKTHSVNSFNNANPDPVTGLYLALNSSKSPVNPIGNGVDAKNFARMMRGNPYAARSAMGLTY